MNLQPLHLDEHYAKGTQHGRRLVAGPMVIGLVIGMARADIGGRAIETLDYSSVRHIGPVFHGDTIYAESTILEKQESPNGRGIVVVETQGINQKTETILTLRRKIVIRMRPRGERA
jgi:acyl dehydratase